MNHALTRRQLLLTASATLCMTGSGAAVAAALPPAVSLPEELTQALKQQQPLVVMVSLEGCPFCKVARDHYLAPMHQEQGLHIVQIDMRSKRMVKNLKGQSVTHDAVSRAWGIKIAPTVLFLGRNGQEVAERLVGGYLPDFYGAYLEERLVQSRAALK